MPRTATIVRTKNHGSTCNSRLKDPVPLMGLPRVVWCMDPLPQNQLSTEHPPLGSSYSFKLLATKIIIESSRQYFPNPNQGKFTSIPTTLTWEIPPIFLPHQKIPKKTLCRMGSCKIASFRSPLWRKMRSFSKPQLPLHWVGYNNIERNR